MRSFPFLIGEAFTNLRRHGLMTAAAITTIAVALALLGSFVVTFYEVDAATHRAVGDFEMRIFCRPELKGDAVKDIGRRIRQLPGVATVRYLSRDAIWKEQTANNPIDVSGVPNLMPDTFVVKLSDGRIAGEIARTIRGWKREVDAVDMPGQELEAVLRIKSFLQTAGMVGGVFLVLGALTVVSNTIRISVFARRREIKIMQVVGAPPWFIRLPLLLEGMFHGIAGGALASAGLVLVGSSLGSLIREEVPLLLPYGVPVDIGVVVLGAVASGALVGVTGSLLSMRRYLRVV